MKRLKHWNGQKPSLVREQHLGFHCLKSRANLNCFRLFLVFLRISLQMKQEHLQLVSYSTLLLSHECQ